MHFGTFVGIDPGTSGAIAVLCGSLLRVYDVPAVKIKRGRTMRARIDPHQLQALMVRIAVIAPDSTFIEDVWGLPGQSAPAAHAFGVTCGQLSQAAVAAGLAPKMVASQVWKQDLRVAGDKGASLARARAEWPGHEAFKRAGDHNRADAALIAFYARKQFLKQHERVDAIVTR